MSSSFLIDRRIRALRSLNELTHHRAWPVLVRQNPEVLDDVDGLLALLELVPSASDSDTVQKLKLAEGQLEALRVQLDQAPV